MVCRHIGRHDDIQRTPLQIQLNFSASSHYEPSRSQIHTHPSIPDNLSRLA